ncbi:MAG: PAS domain-containing protein [Desulfobacterales bacterium]
MNFQQTNNEVCAVSDNDESFRVLVENAPVAIFVHKNGRFVYANHQAVLLYGLSDKSQLLNQHLSAFVHPDDLHKVRETFSKQSNGYEEKHSDELRLVLPGNRVFDLEITSVPVVFAGQKASLSICVNATERKKADAAVLNHLMFLETLIDTIPNPIFYKDIKGTYLGCNTVFAQKILGLPRCKIIGKTVFDLPELIPCEYAETYHEQDQKLFSQSGVQIYESKVRCADDIIRDFVFYKAVYRNAGDMVAGLVGVMVDITELKKVEKNLQRYQEQLRKLTSSMTLSEEFERHRIATSLQEQIGQTLVVSNIKLGILRTAAPAGEMIKALDEIRELIAGTIQDARSLTFELSPPVLHEVGLKAALEWLVEKFENQGKVSYIYNDDGKNSEMDDNIEVMLFRAARELLLNVAFHSNATNAVVTVSDNDDCISISVEDNGVGFDLTKIDTTVSDPSGFGIFSIRERMLHLGGRFEIKSAPGQGTQVTIVSPKKYS